MSIVEIFVVLQLWMVFGMVVIFLCFPRCGMYTYVQMATMACFWPVFATYSALDYFYFLYFRPRIERWLKRNDDLNKRLH